MCRDLPVLYLLKISLIYVFLLIKIATYPAEWLASFFSLSSPLLQELASYVTWEISEVVNQQHQNLAHPDTPGLLLVFALITSHLSSNTSYSKCGP